MAARSGPGTTPRPKSAHWLMSKCFIGFYRPRLCNMRLANKGYRPRSESIGEADFSAWIGLSDQDKRSPVKRMRVAFANLTHRLLQRLCLVRGCQKMPVKRPHELRSAHIVSVPKREQHRPRARVE